MNFLKIHSLPLFLLLTSLSLALSSEFTTAYLRYERSSIVDGELWRLLSAHLVHAGWEHLWLNLFALIIIWMLFKNFLSTSLWWLFTLLSSLYISISFFIFMNQLEWYVGLSGVLHSMMVFGSIAGLIHKRKEFILLLIFILAKVLFEQFYGSFSSDIVMAEGVVIVNAHMYGVIIGAIIGVVLWVLNRYRLIKHKAD
ncbi:MAG: rhombosortase [Sulfurimonas sp.]|nr:rhombosortase [Sulfurimonas sp.]